jgi:hypothetical protein
MKQHARDPRNPGRIAAVRDRFRQCSLKTSATLSIPKEESARSRLAATGRERRSRSISQQAANSRHWRRPNVCGKSRRSRLTLLSLPGNRRLGLCRFGHRSLEEGRLIAIGLAALCISANPIPPFAFMSAIVPIFGRQTKFSFVTAPWWSVHCDCHSVGRVDWHRVRFVAVCIDTSIAVEMTTTPWASCDGTGARIEE